MALIERQVITTWYKPEEKMPKDHVFVIATISFKADRITYDHALVIANWCSDDFDYGWMFTDSIADRYRDLVTVHAWCDLEPYGGGKE